MKATITHQEGMKFEAKTEKNSFVINCPEITPMDYFLSSIICCSATDMVMMPQKQGFEVKNLKVEGDAERNDDFPRKFNTLKLVYTFDSDADDTMAARWVMASLETYCSTINTIRDGVKISYTIVHNGNTIRENEQMISGGGSSNAEFGDIGGCPA